MRVLFNLWFCFFGFLLLGQEKKAGPIINDFGEVWEIPNPDFKTDTSQTYKAVFDIMNSPDDPTVLNSSLETAARFLNMHTQAGIPTNQLRVALVVHNKASKDLLLSQHYETRYGCANPNEPMIKQLLQADVDIVFCGQSSYSRNFPIDQCIDGVQLGLSAMTALIHYQNLDYRFIKF